MEKVIKKNYEAPTMRVVEFRVENGFLGSDPMGVQLMRVDKNQQVSAYQEIVEANGNDANHFGNTVLR